MQLTQDYVCKEALLESLEDYRLLAGENRARRDWLDQAIARGLRLMDASSNDKRRLAALAGLRLMMQERALCDQRTLVLRQTLAGLQQRVAQRMGETE